MLKKILPIVLFGFASSHTIAEETEICNNSDFGNYVIEAPGTYIINGTCTGVIDTGPEIKRNGEILLKGMNNGTLLDSDYLSAYVINGGRRTKFIIENLTVRYDKEHHKAINLQKPGSILRNSSVYGCIDRSTCAGHIKVNGIVDDVYANIPDDTLKISHAGSIVRNSIADMNGNGSGLTMDWGGTSGVGFRAENVTIQGFTNLNKIMGDTIIQTGDGRVWGNHSAVSLISYNDVSDMELFDITFEDGKNFSHLIRIIQANGHKPGREMQDAIGLHKNVWITGSVPDGAQKHTTVNQSVGTRRHSPIVINAGEYDGVIEDVTIDTGGDLANTRWHYLNGTLKNVWIDGTLYDGEFHGEYGYDIDANRKKLDQTSRYVLIKNRAAGGYLKATDLDGGLSTTTDYKDESAYWRMVETSGGYFYLENLMFNNEKLKSADGEGNFDLGNNTGHKSQWKYESNGMYNYLANRTYSTNLGYFNGDFKLSDITTNKTKWKMIRTNIKAH